MAERDDRSPGPGGTGPGGRGDDDGGGPGELDGLLGRLARSMGPGGVELGGENVRLEQEPENGLEVRVTLLADDGSVTSIASMFVPAAEPPPAQPDDVPFVRGAALRVIQDHVRDVLLAMWMLDTEDAPDPDAALAAVLRGSREAGWRLENPYGSEPFRLVRGDRVRRVEITAGHTGPVVSLAQKRLNHPGVEIRGRHS